VGAGKLRGAVPRSSCSSSTSRPRADSTPNIARGEPGVCALNTSLPQEATVVCEEPEAAEVRSPEATIVEEAE
jgi:hypothetical protein